MDLYTPYSMVSFRMILSDPEWLSEIFNDTKHRDSWASCSLRVVFHEKKIFVTPLVWPQRRPHRKSRNLPRKGTPSEFWKCLVAGKLEILRYYMLKKINRLDTIPECDRQTERWTDRQTDGQNCYISIAYQHFRANARQKPVKPISCVYD